MHLAQLNIARTKYDIDSDPMSEFVNNLEPINLLAEQSPGFVWRLQDDSGDATAVQAFDDPNQIVNMSVWESVATLKHFLFDTLHRDFLRRRKEWFHVLAEATYVLWWIPEGHTPTIEEAIERLDHLRKYDDSYTAFTFKKEYQADETTE